jgi:hypothetical protein
MEDSGYWLKQAALAEKLAREIDRPDVDEALWALARRFEQRALAPASPPANPSVIRGVAVTKGGA